MITLAVFWIIWCILHSFLISRVAHITAKRILGHYYPLYRLFYVGFSVLTLIPVLWFQFSLPQQVLIPGSLLIYGIQAVLLFYAGFMFWAGAKVYDMNYFLGLTQWRNFKNQKEESNLPFHSNGILAYVRHPWYSGGIAFVWGVGALTDVYLMTRIILTVYIVVGTLLEESRLEKELGSGYKEYCRNVPMLIPWKYYSKRFNR